MTYHTHWTGEILDLDLGNPATRPPGEGIFWNPDTGKYESDTRTHAIGDYVNGTLYNQGEELFDGSNLSEAKRNDVTSYPYVTPFGTPSYVYEGVGMASADQQASQIIFGNRYTNVNKPYYLTGYRVFTKTGTTYQVTFVIDPLGTPEADDILNFTSASDGWLDLSIAARPVDLNTTFDLFVKITKKPDTPTTVVIGYNYLLPQNAANPLEGEVVQGRSTPDSMNISYTSNGGITNDVIATIQGLNIGDTILAADGGQWTVQSNLDQTTFAVIGVSPSAVGVAGIQDFTFETTVPTPLPVASDPAYWPTSPYTAEGFLAVDDSYLNAAYSTTAYGVDILIQDAYIPPAEDWWLKIIGNGDGSPVVLLSETQTAWVVANTQIVSPNDVVTTDDTWTEVFRGMVETNKGFKAVLSTDSKRLDATGYYAALRTFLAYDVAGVVTIIPGNINELGDNLDVRAIVDGTDVVIEVQGKNGQDWSWTTTTEYKEID